MFPDSKILESLSQGDARSECKTKFGFALCLSNLFSKDIED